ncbi:unnamed protein product, partial [marine sediment metagenome]
PYVGDLIITLESPNGTRVELISNACSAGEDIDVVFEDNGNDLICSGIPPVVTGMVKPTQQLSSIISENSTGNWKLIIEDTGDVDIGTLEGWSLELCTSEPVLGVNSFVFEDFKVYPNPSNGIINIQFTSKNTSDVEITVFDLLGRKIRQKVFLTNNISFKESIQIRH